MKLFGDTGKHLHSGKPKKENTERKRIDLKAFFHAPVWRKLRIPLIVVGGVIVFLLVALLIYTIWEKQPDTVDEGPKSQVTELPAETAAQPTPLILADPMASAPPAPEPTPAPTSAPSEAPTSGRKENCYTFVILGYDKLTFSTDSIIVGRLDAGAGTLDFVSIPRDTLVNVSWGVKKLYTVLASERNDPERFLEHLGNLVGFTCDCYAVVNTKAVEKLVDCIGGVYYNVPRDMDYDDPTQDLYIHIPKGEQRLNGDEAAKVLRYMLGNNGRGYPNGDLGRIETQQDFMMSFARQFLTFQNIPNLDNAIEIFRENVTTNMDSGNLAYFAREFLTMQPENIRFHTLPGSAVLIRGGSYWQVRLEEWLEIVNENLNPYYQVITADNLNILQAAAGTGAVSTTGEEVPETSFLDFNHI